MARAWTRATLLWWLSCLAAGIVDEAGRYRAGGDISELAPPEPTEEDRNASIDLHKQPVEKLFRLLGYELWREEKRDPEGHFSVTEFQTLTDLSCPERLVSLVQDAARVAEEVRVYHLNVTGLSGLYWTLHKYPEEHSWVWLIAVSHDRVLRKVEGHLARLSTLAQDDHLHECLSPGLRTVLMNAAVTWKRISGDQIALLWNGVAFGILGDVTSWRELDEDGQTAQEGPGGPPPNVSWSENLIFANMWISSVQRWLQHHQEELTQAVRTELARAQAGLPQDDGRRWLRDKDGILPTFEMLRRQLWGGWQLDKGLLRGLLRHCLRPSYGSSEPVSLADFGAGGGQYSEWLNDTGLVHALAFDATQAAKDITGGRVQELNLATDIQLWRTFDWVLCLDVLPYLPKDQQRRLLQNIRRHADRGLVVSWEVEGQEVDNLQQGRADLISLVEAETGFVMDSATTGAVRGGCELPHMASTVAVFIRGPA